MGREPKRQCGDIEENEEYDTLIRSLEECVYGTTTANAPAGSGVN